MHWEYPVVHLLNYAIFLTALFSFEFFWRGLLTSKGDKTWVGEAQSYAWALGYLLFACIHFGAGELALVSPDLLVAAVVYLASGMMLRFANGKWGMASAVLLGVLLGVGYLAKAAMLPFAVVLMMTMFALAWRQHQRKCLVAATLLSCMLISLPFIAALSWNAHRFTWGSSAKLNMGWCVNNVRPPYRHWQGDRPGHEDALHPARRVFGWPEIYEFATPIAGTYPLWYDPGYWYAGLDSSVHPVLVAKAFLRNTSQIANYLFRTLGFLTTVVLMMTLLSDRIKDSWRLFMAFWPVLVHALAVLMMYAMVFWEQRYTSGAILLGCGVVMASMSISEEKWRIKVLRAASLMLGLMIVCWVLPLLMLNYSYRLGGQSAQQVVVAERLQTMGIEHGDHVAVIGDSMKASLWARLEKVRIVAEMPDDSGTDDSTAAFWQSSAESEQSVLNILKNTGAKAVIASTPPKVLPPGWTQIGDTGHAVYFFR